MLLNHPFKRPGTIDWVKPGFEKFIQHRIAEAEFKVMLGKPASQQFKLDGGNTAQLFFGEGMEDHDFINPIDKFGAEVTANNIHH